jgi:chromosome segregation ATPase
MSIIQRALGSLDGLENQISDCRKDRDLLIRRLDEVRLENDVLKRTETHQMIEMLKGEIDAGRSNHKKRVDELEEKLRDRENEIRHLNEQVKNQRESIEYLKRGESRHNVAAAIERLGAELGAAYASIERKTRLLRRMSNTPQWQSAFDSLVRDINQELKEGK